MGLFISVIEVRTQGWDEVWPASTLVCCVSSGNESTDLSLDSWISTMSVRIKRGRRLTSWRLCRGCIQGFLMMPLGWEVEVRLYPLGYVVHRPLEGFCYGCQNESPASKGCSWDDVHTLTLLFFLIFPDVLIMLLLNLLKELNQILSHWQDEV